MKLAKELSKRATGRTLYILDEPTTGLHFHDIEQLLDVLHRLRDEGNTIVVIEHNLDVIKTADWIIDLGPEGGAGGGTIVATGTPEEIAANEKSYTGQYLRRGDASGKRSRSEEKSAAGLLIFPPCGLPDTNTWCTSPCEIDSLNLPPVYAADDRAPELHGRLVVDELDDLPRAGEAIEDQRGGVAPDAEAARARRDEEIGHAEVDLRPLMTRRAAHQREAGGLVVLEDDERMRGVVGEPARHELLLALAVLALRREHPGVHALLRKVFEVFRVLRLDPGAVAAESSARRGC